MKVFPASAVLMAAGLLITVPAFAQQKPDAATPATTAAKKQHTDGSSPTQVGPGSAAYKQRTQSMSHSDGSPVGVVKQN